MVMFQKLFSGVSRLLARRARNRTIAGSAMAGLAAELLIAPTALMQLTASEAHVVVGYMEPRRIAADTLFIKAGDTGDTAYMLLLLEGEVTVENMSLSDDVPETVSVLGPGSLIGELSLLDGLARTASCTATSDIRCAVLSRQALEQLSRDDPHTATKLMFAVALRVAERLRDTSDKLRLHGQLVKALQLEVDHLMGFKKKPPHRFGPED
jgi:CRP-like cAMP-binding protein